MTTRVPFSMTDAPVNVRAFGAKADGVTDDSAAFAAAFAASSSVTAPAGNYRLANITIPAGATLHAGGATFTKAANGNIFAMGERTQILGGPVFDGNASAYTGSSIIINTGFNGTYSQQGHQLVEYATFRNSEGYHVGYFIPNQGWMSRLLECKFIDVPTNPAAPAMVFWPNDGGATGNRYIIGGYSLGPVVNVSSADNGVIANVTVGASAANPTQQGVYFPASSAPQKLIITGNRFAYGTNSMTVRGANHIIADNVFAGGVTLASGAVNCVVGPNIYASPAVLTDSSGAVNQVFEAWRNYTPSIVSGLTLGNGTIVGEYKRDGEFVEFRMQLDFGSTTSVSGTMTFGTPVAGVSGNTNVYVGQAFVDPGYSGATRIRPDLGQFAIYNMATLATWNATVPLTWTTGSRLVAEGRYRI